MVYTGTKNREPVRIHWGGEDEYFDIPPFIPEPAFVQAVNQSFASGWPLLVKGDHRQCIIALQTVYYELYGPEFVPRYFAVEMGKFFSSLEDLLYKFDHARKKRDLEYHQLNPERNPIYPPEEYLVKGPILNLMEFQQNNGGKPVLEIRNVQKAKEGFVADLMDFFLKHRSVKVFETGEVFTRGFTFPVLFMTAPFEYTLPAKGEYDGIIHTFRLNPSRELLLENLKLQFREMIVHEPEMEGVIEKFVDLFSLIKNTARIKRSKESFPTSDLELVNAIEGKWGAIMSGQVAVGDVLEELSAVIDEQQALFEGVDISEIIPEIIEAIKDAEFRKAFEKLDVIQWQLPEENQVEVNSFIARFNDINRTEMLGTESELILHPRKNKLMLDVMTYLKSLEVGK